MSVFGSTLRIWNQRVRLRLGRLVEQRWINLGLRAKMSALVLVGLIGLLTVFALMGISTTRQATQQVLSERVTLARVSATNIDSTLRQVQSVLLLTSNRAILRDPLSPLPAQQEVLQQAYQEISSISQGIYLLDRYSRQVTAVSSQPMDIDWRQVASVQAALRWNESPAHPSIITGDHPQAVVVVPLADQMGQQAGVLAALLDFSSSAFFPFEQPFNLGDTGAVDVIDSQGVVLLSSHPEHLVKPEDLKKFLSQLFVAGDPVVETCLGCYGESSQDAGDEVIAFAPLTQAHWGVVVRQKAAEAFAPVRNLMIRILILSLVTVAGALGLVWVTTSSVIHPVQLLTEAAQRIASGDLATPIDFPGSKTSRKDEIGTLGAAFIHMRHQLKQSMDEIHSWNQELDARVQERTQALQASQQEAQAAHDDLQAVIDALSDELVVIDVEDYSIQQVNQVVRLRHPAINDSRIIHCYELEDQEHPCELASQECPVALVLANGKSAKATHIFECFQDNRPCYMEIVASPMRDASGKISRIVELKRNVTEEINLKESLVRTNQQLAILNAVANTVNQSLNLEDILERALDEVLRLTEIDIGAIYLQDNLSGALQLMAYRGLSEDTARNAAQFGILDNSCGGIRESGQITIVPDLSRLHTRRARSLQKERLSTLVHIPLTIKGSILGSMCVGTRRLSEFDTEEQDLLNAIGNQIAVAVENAQLYEEVQHKERVRGELFKKAISAQEEERKRIARELHDDTSQALTALLFAAEEGLEMNNLAEVSHRLESIRELAQRTLDGVHKVIFDLRPSMLDHLGLVPALRWLASNRLETKGIRVLVEEASLARRLPAEVETVIFRAVQEAISNIARHSGARNASIYFRFDEESIQVTVEDDGIGFDVDEITLSPDSTRGLGLLSMQERVELLGGDLEVDSHTGAGTRIDIRVPLNGGRPVNA